MEKKHLSYNDIDTACWGVSQQIKALGVHIDLVVGILRGGFIPAYLIAHNLDTNLHTITWQTRDGNTQEVSDYVQSQISDGKNVLFVDDINDSGRTLTEISQVYNPQSTTNVLTATLCSKETSSFLVDFSALDIGDEWIVFPWENQH